MAEPAVRPGALGRMEQVARAPPHHRNQPDHARAQVGSMLEDLREIRQRAEGDDRQRALLEGLHQRAECRRCRRGVGERRVGAAVQRDPAAACPRFAFHQRRHGRVDDRSRRVAEHRREPDDPQLRVAHERGDRQAVVRIDVCALAAGGVGVDPDALPRGRRSRRRRAVRERRQRDFAGAPALDRQRKRERRQRRDDRGQLQRPAHEWPQHRGRAGRARQAISHGGSPSASILDPSSSRARGHRNDLRRAGLCRSLLTGPVHQAVRRSICCPCRSLRSSAGCSGSAWAS